MPRVNLSGVATSFEILPEGKFPANFTRFKNGVSKNKNLTVSLEFTLSPEARVMRADTGVEESLGGRKAFRTFAFTDNALWAFKKTLIQLGVPSDDPRLEDNSGIDTDEILAEYIGADVTLDITRTEYEGKPSNNVEIVDDLSW